MLRSAVVLLALADGYTVPVELDSGSFGVELGVGSYGVLVVT